MSTSYNISNVFKDYLIHCPFCKKREIGIKTELLSNGAMHFKSSCGWCGKEIKEVIINNLGNEDKITIEYLEKNER